MPADDGRRPDEILSKASAILTLPKEHEESSIIVRRMIESSGQRSGRNQDPRADHRRIPYCSWYLKAIVCNLDCVRF